MDVKIVKFISGQEIIAKVLSVDEKTMVIETPITIQPMRTSEANISIGLVPFSWAGMATTPVVIKAEHVLCTLEPQEDIKTQYLAGIAGISVPTPPPTPRLTLVE